MKKGIVLNFVHKYNTMTVIVFLNHAKRSSISEQTHLRIHKDHMSNPIPEIQAAYNKKKGQPKLEVKAASSKVVRAL